MVIDRQFTKFERIISFEIYLSFHYAKRDVHIIYFFFSFFMNATPVRKKWSCWNDGESKGRKQKKKKKQNKKKKNKDSLEIIVE